MRVWQRRVIIPIAAGLLTLSQFSVTFSLDLFFPHSVLTSWVYFLHDSRSNACEYLPRSDIYFFAVAGDTIFTEHQESRFILVVLYPISHISARGECDDGDTCTATGLDNDFYRSPFACTAWPNRYLTFVLSRVVLAASFIFLWIGYGNAIPRHGQ